jgi:hypothetical protein
MKRKFWKIADALFRISWMTNSFRYRARRSVLPLHFSTGPSKLFKFGNCLRHPLVEPAVACLEFTTADLCKRVVFGDLLLHLPCMGGA